MKIRDIENFFREVDQRIDFPIQVIITGGALAAFYGSERVTQDIDFELALKPQGRKSAEAWRRLEEVMLEVGRKTEITPQYSDDIDRWSSIAIPEKSSRLYKRIGHVEIRLLDPDLWAIGKLTRFLDSDQDDLVTVLKKAKVKPQALAKRWGHALAKSPSSLALDNFRRQIQMFFRGSTKEIWGSRADAEKLIEIFMKSARSSR